MDEGWTIEPNAITNEMFKDNIKNFPNSGGDMETLLHLVKIEHSKRIFGKHNYKKKNINAVDIKNGLDQFIILANRRNKEDPIITTMYM